MKKHGIFIGRFQPVHEGHIASLVEAAKQVETLLIFVGSVNLCRSIKNPWTYAERAHMITTKLRPYCTNFKIVPLNDYRYDDNQWKTDVFQTAKHLDAVDPVLFGHGKEGNDYLTWFPNWEYVNINAVHNICATDVRKQMFESCSTDLPVNVMNDWDYFQRERALFSEYPYPESLNLNCGDAVVTCDNHVLLVKRKRAPGADTWALPGGHKNTNETFLECAIRELFEETQIAYDEKFIRFCVRNTQLFDDPSRSHGIPRATLAVHVVIPPMEPLPLVFAADDAAACRWIPIDEALNNYQLFDDHAAIISKMLERNPFPAVARLPIVLGEVGE